MKGRIKMRVANWNPEKYDLMIETASIERLKEGAEVVAKYARQKCPIGTVSRPIYKTGVHAGKLWTSRDAGRLKKSIRVVQKLGKSGKPLKRKSNVRIYSGNYLAYYSGIVEYSGKAYLRPALTQAHSEIMSIFRR